MSPASRSSSYVDSPTMCWDSVPSRFMICASRRKRFRAFSTSAPVIRSTERILSASIHPPFSSRTLYTVPNPPAPMRLSTRHLLRRSWPMRGSSSGSSWGFPSGAPVRAATSSAVNAMVPPAAGAFLGGSAAAPCPPPAWAAASRSSGVHAMVDGGGCFLGSSEVDTERASKR